MKTNPGQNLLQGLDYSVLQQCMHCGMCLPTCPTYDATQLERNSPRGRIALMRAIADERLPVTKSFGEEMYYCLGCLACESACPAGVDYTHLFETARAEIERSGVLDTPQRTLTRSLILRHLFGHRLLLHGVGRMLYLYQASGLQSLVRRLGLTRLLPKRLREMETLTPTVRARFSDQLIHETETPAGTQRLTVGMLTGCVQDMLYSEINRDTVDVLLAAGCRVITPRGQLCCGSLHGHNGDMEQARIFAKKLINRFDLAQVDIIITNAAGCGSHLKHYDRLLADDPDFAERARLWSAKLRDINEFLVEIGFHKDLPATALSSPGQAVTYHEACHLCHGQKISAQPRQLLQALPGVKLRELPESTWCCGSAGVYNITQPDQSRQLAERKLANILKTGCGTVATANPGCLLQLEKIAETQGKPLRVVHPITLVAEALRRR